MKARVRIACQGSTKEAVPFLLDLLAQVENKFRIELVMFLCKVLLLVIYHSFSKVSPFLDHELFKILKQEEYRSHGSKLICRRF